MVLETAAEIPASIKFSAGLSFLTFAFFWAVAIGRGRGLLKTDEIILGVTKKWTVCNVWRLNHPSNIESIVLIFWVFAQNGTFWPLKLEDPRQTQINREKNKTII